MAIFNEFPYTNFHELNLDWILEKIKAAGGSIEEIEAQIKALQEEINNIRYEDNDYYSNEQAWHVIKVKDGYVLSRYIVNDEQVQAILRTTSGGQTVPAYWLTGLKKKILPVPILEAAIAGNVESYLGVVTNARIIDKSTFERRLMLFDPATGPDGSTKRFGVNVIVTGKHAVPEDEPNIGIKPKRFEAVDIADSYYRARTVLGREFAYGKNFITYAASDAVNNVNGAAMMECDTFVALVMMGIPYNESPYIDDSPNLTYDFADLVANPDNLTWPLPWKYNATLDRKVTYTGGQNWYYWSNDMVFKDPALAASGDIAIFRRAGGKYFDGITHTGIVHRRDGELWLYHVTGSDAVPSPMMYEPLSNVVERGGYTMKDNVYFARPNYE